MIAGSAPAMPLAAGTVALALLPAFLILGAILGVLGTALNASILRMLNVSARVHARAPFAYPAAVGLAVGALFILMPGTVTGGERVILNLAGDRPAWSCCSPSRPSASPQWSAATRAAPPAASSRRSSPSR